MKPSSRSPSCCRVASVAPNKTAPCIPFLMETFPVSSNSGLTHNIPSCHMSRSSVDTNGNAAVSRRGQRVVRKPGRPQCKYQSSTAVRGKKTGLVKKKRKSSAHRVVSKPRREQVRQKQKNKLVVARLGAAKAVKGYLAGAKTLRRIVTITKTKRCTIQRGKTNATSKKRSQAGKPKLSSRTARSPVRAKAGSRRNKGNARRRDSSDESAHSSVSRYELVPRDEASHIPSCSGASKRRRSERNSSKESTRSERQHHRHKDRSWNRRQERSDSRSTNSGSQCCNHMDRSPLQSPIRSLTPRRQDSTMMFASRSKDGHGHHSKNRSDNKCSSNNRSSDSETDNGRGNEKIRGGDRKSRKDRDDDTFFACVVM